jgi:hypothetical protein
MSCIKNICDISVERAQKKKEPPQTRIRTWISWVSRVAPSEGLSNGELHPAFYQLTPPVAVFDNYRVSVGHNLEIDSRRFLFRGAAWSHFSPSYKRFLLVTLRVSSDEL